MGELKEKELRRWWRFRQSSDGSLAPFGAVYLALLALGTVGALAVHLLLIEFVPGASRTKLDAMKTALLVVAGSGAGAGLYVQYRKQQTDEAKNALDHANSRRDQDKLFTERYTQAVAQLGNGAAAVRLGGVYALARIADDSARDRPTCLKVLCAYLRMPYDPDDPKTDSAEREVRTTAQAAIAERLVPGHSGYWRGARIDLTAAYLIDPDFRDIAAREFIADSATFRGNIRFRRATFNGDASFDKATFGGDAHFEKATFSGVAQFYGAIFNGNVLFEATAFAKGSWFATATFNKDARFDKVAFAADARFEKAAFNEDAGFDKATFNGAAWFDTARFGRAAWFEEATFTRDAVFRTVTFTGATRFVGAKFYGHTVFGGRSSEGKLGSAGRRSARTVPRCGRTALLSRRASGGILPTSRARGPIHSRIRPVLHEYSMNCLNRNPCSATPTRLSFRRLWPGTR